MSIVAEPTFTVEPVVAATSGLSFPGNADWDGPFGTASTSIMLGWNVSVFGTGAPMGAYPATYIWKCYPRLNQGWWTMLFHAKWETSFTQELTNEYYGCHPYQDGYASPLTPVPPQWEISSHGGDTYSDGVTYDTWHTQVVRTWEAGGDEHIRYYWNWPNTTTDVVSVTQPSEAVATNQCIVIGDAPWNQGYECCNAILRGYQIYDAILSEADVANELTTPGTVRTPWYLNLNPTPTDVTDKSGNGNDPDWLNVNRPSLWTP